MEEKKETIKGLDLARDYFTEYGLPLLERDFPEVLPQLAAGLFGSGSECFGFDDGQSRDHDFEPGFCLMLPGEDQVDRKTAFRLERALASLPKEYKGLSRSLVSPVGGPRKGVIRLADFFTDKTGSPDGVLSLDQWLRVPQESLAEAVNGEVFMDQLGELTKIRESLAFYPEDIRRKKLAGHLLLMAQAGQYNYQRCLVHGETGAAQLAVFTFTDSCMKALFLLNKSYSPFYKWSFRALRALPILSFEAELLEFLISSDNEQDNAEEKYAVMEGIAEDLVGELQAQGLTGASCHDLEQHALSVNDRIEDGTLRNMHILAGV